MLKDLFKPIQLKSTDNIVKWAYLGVDEYNRPRVTSLCSVFWRSVLLTPAKLIGMLVLYVGVCGVLGMISYEDWRVIPIIILGCGTLLGVILLCVFIKTTAEKKGLANKLESLTLVKGFKAVKEQYCPVVYID